MWGQTNIPPGLSDVVAIAAGYHHNLALKKAGTLVVWGNNSAGQANVPSGLSNLVAVAGGGFHSLALKADSTVAAWGSNAYGQTNVPPGLSNVVAIAGGGSHNCALRSDGAVVAWGLNDQGQASVPVGLNNVVSVACGGDHSLALWNDGSPFIIRQPLNQTTYGGLTAILNASALGQPPLFYQWQFNETNIVGATNALLILRNIPLNRAGSYRCVVSNLSESTISFPAVLTVLDPTPRFDTSSAAMQLTSEGFGTRLIGLFGPGEVVIYASTNLVEWRPIFTNPPIAGPVEFLDSAAANLPFRFYKANEQ